MVEQTKITSGKIAYGLTVCPKQYESKRADVELTFSVGEDDSYEAVFDRASRAVINRCRTLCDLPELGKKPGPPTTVEPTKIEIKGANLFGE